LPFELHTSARIILRRRAWSARIISRRRASARLGSRSLDVLCERGEPEL